MGARKGARDPTLAQIRGDNPGVLGSGDQVIGYPEFLRTKITDASPVPEGINLVINKRSIRVIN